MPRGGGNHRVYHPNPVRGRGRGRGRGGGRGRGRGGRGGGSRGGFRGAPPMGTHESLEDDLVFNGNVEDFTLENITLSSHHGGASPVRGHSGHQTPRGIQSGRGRLGRVMRGLGFSGRSPKPRIPMSILEKDRPLLRPIIFVRGKHQKTLFEEVEEILHAPGEEEKTLEEQAPSADLVEKIFQHEEPLPSSDIDTTSESGDHADEEVTFPEPTITEDKDAVSAVTVDITPSHVDIASQASDNPVKSSVIKAAPQDEADAAHDGSPLSDIQMTVTTDKGLASVVDITQSIVNVPSQVSEDTVGDSELVAPPQSEVAHEGVANGRAGQSDLEPKLTEDNASTFFIDTTPSIVDSTSKPSEHIVDSFVIEAVPLGEAADDDVIVYEAPHPRLRSRAPFPPVALASNAPQLDVPATPTKPTNPHQHPVSTPIDSVSISFAAAKDPDLLLSKNVQARRAIGLKPTPRSRKLVKKERAAARRREGRKAILSLTSFGLNMEERAALQEGSTVKRDPRYAERRRNDSDIDWGTDDEGSIEEIRSGIGEMDLDGEVGGIAMLTRFARGVEGLAGEEVVTIADLEDDGRMKDEDEETGSDEDSSSQDDAVAFDAAEKKEIGEGADVNSSESSEEDTPRRSFQGRLQRMRAQGKVKTVPQASLSSDEEGDSDEGAVVGQGMSWADRDERYLEDIDDALNEDAHLQHGGGRTARNAKFKAILNGDFRDDYDDLNYNMRKKDRHIPPELHDQWKRDKKKKAERKHARALARMQGAAELSPTRKSSRGKDKVLGGARFRGDTLYASRINDMGVLEELIRTFLDNLDAKNMVLPPKSRDWRRRAHSLADAFSLKSKSKGKGEGRFMTLMKTTKSGVHINEHKVSTLVNGYNGEGHPASERARRTIRHRDGDEVGKMAPKLSDSNIGFKLLQQMGWEEGERIGVTGGLADPLTAIIKTTKLGLGATRDAFR